MRPQLLQGNAPSFFPLCSLERRLSSEFDASQFGDEPAAKFAFHFAVAQSKPLRDWISRVIQSATDLIVYFRNPGLHAFSFRHSLRQVLQSPFGLQLGDLQKPA